MKSWLSLFICAALLVVIAMTVPAGAFGSTHWSHFGVPINENATVTLQGEMAMTMPTGALTCPYTADVVLTPGETEPNMHFNSFTATEPAKCHATGYYAVVCGTYPVTKLAKSGTWHASTKGPVYTKIESNHVEISGFELQWTMGSCLIGPQLLKGTITLQADNLATIKKFTPSGTLMSSLGIPLVVTGIFSVAPSGTYGIE